MLNPYFKSQDKSFYLLHGDTMELLPQFHRKFDMVFADPPYFLSNGGLTVNKGDIVSVNKGDWDKSKGIVFVNEFNRQWLTLVREVMKEEATIWISGTMHNIFSIGQILIKLGFKILNIITWQKTNPPPNFSCRYFTHSTEQIIWARKEEKTPHYFNYKLMKELNGNKQMKDVWRFPAIAPWEKSKGIVFVNEFNRQWLTLVREVMKEEATIWISGTMHNIFSIGQILIKLGFKILNIITWQKTNPPPNFSCRYFTHSTEQIIWARKEEKTPHYFNYKLMKELNGNKQMKDVWRFPAIAPWEKSCGKHPTQKPLSVLTRFILASTKPDAWILDPFTGSSTTGIAANLQGRKFVGIDREKDFLELSKRRKLEISIPKKAETYRIKLSKITQLCSY